MNGAEMSPWAGMDWYALLLRQCLLLLQIPEQAPLESMSDPLCQCYQQKYNGGYCKQSNGPGGSGGADPELMSRVVVSAE